MYGVDSREVQATASALLTHSHLSSIGSFYRARRDVLAQRALLESSLSDFAEYMQVLSLFLHGLCDRDQFDEMMQIQITSDRLAHLHNEFLRCILHNAHFSMVSPPNVTIVKRPPAPPPERAAPRAREASRQVQPLTAIDLRRLPTRRELSQRVSCLPRPALDDAAVALLSATMRRFAKALLHRAAQVQPRGLGAGERPHVRVGQIFVLCQHAGMDRVVSPAVLTKYSLVRAPQRPARAAAT
jgi:hypothetical protein